MKGINEKKIKALELLTKGSTITSIAEIVGVHRNTIYYWINNDEDFKKVKQGLEERMTEDLYAISLLEAEEMLINGKSHEKLAIIQLLTKIKHKDKLDVTVKPLTLDDMIRKIER